MRQIFYRLSVLALLLLLCPSMYASFEVDGIYYEIIEENKTEVEVVKKKEGKYSGNVVIPQDVRYYGKTYNVTSIGWGAFEGCKGLTSVTIGDNVTSIGGVAFYDCTSLTSVTIPSNVTSIGKYAFCGCSGLTSVTIPDSIKIISNDTFRDCI